MARKAIAGKTDDQEDLNRYRDLLLGVMDVCIIKIRLSDYSIVEYNDAMCRMLGCTREEYEARILMDMRMPIMDGLEATRKIRALQRIDAKSVPIIAMTADVFEESIREAKEAGMADYCTKPIDPEKMYSILAKNLNKSES